MSNPLLSIITSMYNVSPYLEEAIESVTSQDYLNLELIIIDDASSDDSLKIAKALASRDNRIKVFHFDENQGLAAARNAGVRLSSGDFIAFFDSDDIIHPKMYDRLMKLILDTDSDFVSCLPNCFYVNSSGELKYTEWQPISFHHHFDKLVYLETERDKSIYIKNYYPDLWCKIFRRRFLDENDIFFPSLIYEDISYYVKIVHSCKRFSLLDENYYHYRMRPGQLTSKVTKDIFYSANLAFNYIDKAEVFNPAFRDAMVYYVYRTIFHNTIYNNKYHVYYKNFLNSFKYSIPKDFKRMEEIVG